MRPIPVVLALALAAGLAAPAVASPSAVAAPDGRPGLDGTAVGVHDGGGPRAASGANRSAGAIVAVYANPVAARDRGEYVVVEHPPGAGWTLSDGEATVRLPGAAERVVVTPHPDAVDVTGRVVAAPDLRLANGGERLRLGHGEDVVDEVSYDSAPESEVLRPDDGGWQPRGATDFRVAEAGPASVAAFVLPDAPDVAVETIRAADRRALLAAYTLTSWRVARALAAARQRGADVAVLVDGGPVGGMTRRQARVLDWLADRGVAVSVMAGPRARYTYQHAKYAVVDDRALVLTENFKPSGTGGRASRGWGAVVEDRAVAAHLAEVFRADTGWNDTTPWREFREGRSFEPSGTAEGSYPSRFEAREVRAERVRVLVAPDNAEPEVVERVRGAEESVLVQQVSVGGRDQPFLQAALAAARDGASVRVLLSSAWYVEAENRRLVEWLEEVAREEGLDVEARLAEPRSRYGKIHAKGVVVDGETVVVGSLNWNNHSSRENREVALVLEGDEVAGYYARAFRADWRGGTRRVPAGVVVAVVLLAGGGLLATRTVTFERP